MNKRLNERGSIGIVVLLILFFLTTIGISVMVMSGTDLKTAYNIYWKGKSDALVDFSVKEYKDRIQSLFIQDGSYNVNTIDTSQFDTKEFTLKEDGKNKANINFFEVKRVSNGIDTSYRYLDDILGTKSENNAILYKNPPVDDDFMVKDYKGIIGNETGITSVESIFNNAYNSNEFFISKAIFDSEYKFKEVKLFNYFPLIEDSTEGPLFSVTKEELENQIKEKTGKENALANLALNDNINIGVAWDSSVSSPIINMAISVKKENKVYLFTSTPIVDSKFFYFDTVTEADEIKKTMIKSSYDANVNAVVNTLSISLEKDNGETYLNNYTFYSPSDDKVDLSSKTTLDFENESRTFTVSTYWNDVLKSTEIMLFSVENSNSESNGTDKIIVYKMAVGIDNELKKENEIDVSSLGIKRVHSMGSSVFWNKELNDGYVHLIFAAANENDPKAKHKVFQLESNVINFDSSNIRELPLEGTGLTNIGNIGVAGMYNEFGELMVVMEKAIASTNTITLENKDKNSLEITSYEDNKSGREAAKTDIRLKTDTEVVNMIDSNIKFIKSFKIKDLEIK